LISVNRGSSLDGVAATRRDPIRSVLARDALDIAAAFPFLSDLFRHD
jgi:hypothetical protein